jgi:transfer complex protein
MVDVNAASDQVINPFDIVLNTLEGNPVDLKAESLLSMMRVLLGGGPAGLSTAQESILDRSIRAIYNRFLADPEKNEMPTLLTLYEELLGQPEEAARGLATALEMYAKGTFSGFARQTNVDMSNRFIYYDISKLGDHMKTFGMMVVMDQVWNRVLSNFGRGIRTWLYVDEFHLMFTNPHALRAFLSIYKRARKYGLLPTGITQNVEELLAVPEARLMLANCDVLFLLGQKTNDADELAELLKLSDEQVRAFTNVEPGFGLLTFGSMTLPFNSRKSHDPMGPLVELLNTEFQG